MGLWSDVSLLWPITEEGSSGYGQEIRSNEIYDWTLKYQYWNIPSHVCLGKYIIGYLFFYNFSIYRVQIVQCYFICDYKLTNRYSPIWLTFTIHETLQWVLRLCSYLYASVSFTSVLMSLCFSDLYVCVHIFTILTSLFLHLGALKMRNRITIYICTLWTNVTQD